MLWMLWSIPILACCLSGFVLFRARTIPTREVSADPDEEPTDRRRLSVIIPARNEETNLPYLLQSLAGQSRKPDEIIVVDDRSTDRTRELASSFEGVTVVENAPLPPGWTGKNWAVWNGFAKATGELIAFIDADVRLAPDALQSLVAARNKTGGVVSVVPYHVMETWHEGLALVTNLLGAFAFMSPWESDNPRKGLYGSCILTTRADYKRVKGHESIRSEVLDDLNLGARYREAGIPVANFLGSRLVSFRMYPSGIRGALEGFGKSAALSTARLHPVTIALNAVWVVGLLASELFWLSLGTPWFWPLSLGYLFYMLQMFYLVKYIGRFRITTLLLHVLSGLFFLVMMAYSLYQVNVLGRVKWKGRDIETGGG